MCIVSNDCGALDICVDRFCVSAGPLVDAGGQDSGDDGGGSMDADAGRADAGPGDAGQPRCVTPDCNLCADLHPGALLCENFDDTVETPWVPRVSQGGTVNLDTANFIAGGASMRAVAPLGGNAYYRNRLAIPIETGELFVRMYLYVEPTTRVNDFAIVFDLADGTSDKLSVDLIPGSSLNLVRKNMDDSIREAIFLPVPAEKWTCVEFHHRISETGVDGLLGLTIDGQPVDSLSPITAPAPATGFRNVSVGLRAGSQSTAEALIDEFVMSADGPIGCIP